MKTVSGTLGDLLGALNEVARAGTSGVLYLRVDGNHAAQICVHDGGIVGLRFGPCRGRRALALFKLASAFSWRFDETALACEALIDHDLGPPAVVLSELRQGTDPAPIDIKAARAALMPELIRHLGPIAELLFDKAWDQCGGPGRAPDWDRLIGLLAAEIDVPEEAAEFEAGARRIVARLQTT